MRSGVGISMAFGLLAVVAGAAPAVAQEPGTAPATPPAATEPQPAEDSAPPATPAPSEQDGTAGSVASPTPDGAAAPGAGSAAGAAAVTSPVSDVPEATASPSAPASADDVAPTAAEPAPPPDDAAFGDGVPLPEPAAAASDEDEGASQGPSNWVWATSGIAAGALVAGTVFGFLALNEESAFHDTPTAAIANRGDNYALVADIFLAIAVVSGATAIVLHFAGGDDDEESEDSPQVSVAPVVGPGVGGMTARVRF